MELLDLLIAVMLPGSIMLQFSILWEQGQMRAEIRMSCQRILRAIEDNRGEQCP